MESFNYILLLLGFAVIMVSLLRQLHLPAVLGYLSVGFLIGPGGLSWIPSMEELAFLAEFGVVFLMFTLGLEFSIPKLMSSKSELLGVGGAQVVSCTLLGGAGCYFLGLNLSQSFVMGGALALSSTAVVVKQLSEQKEQHEAHGNLSINILLFQDIAAVLFLILIPAIAGHEGGDLGLKLGLTLLKGIAVFVGMALIGMWLLRPLFHWVAQAHSTELFMLATLFVVLSAAAVTHYFDLSMALGAFLAGLMLGETEFRHQIEIDIRPFRDVLLGLFFIVIGAYLELSTFPQSWHLIVVAFVALITLKFIIIFGMTLLIGDVPKEVALRTALILAHGGEFGFVLLTEATKHNLVDTTQRPAIFAAMVLSLMVAPVIIRFNRMICNVILFQKRSDFYPESPSQELAFHAAELDRHVILCGFGRVGQVLGRFLDQESIPWLALDMDPMRISNSSIAGEYSFYGNVTHPQTLISAGLSRARMVVITFADEHTALKTLEHVRSIRLDVPVFVRTRDDSNLYAFQEAGATEVVPELLEGSLMLAFHLLLTLGVPAHKIISKVRQVHSNRYSILQGFYRGHEEVKTFEGSASQRRSLHSIIIPDNAEFVSRSLEDVLPHQSENGPKINALTREDERYMDPDPHMMLQPGDVIVVYATLEEKCTLEEKILKST